MCPVVGSEVGGGRRGSDGVEQRGPERAADLLGGVDQRAGDARVVRSDADEGGAAEGDEGEPEADADDDLGRQDVGHVACVHADLGEPEPAPEPP